MTVHSDWGDWLPRAVESADPAGVEAWYLGCNGFVLKGRDGTTLFVDPYLGTGDPPRTVRMIPVPFDPADVRHADAVLATHEHSDHVDAASQAPLLTGAGADFYGTDTCLAATDDQDWAGEWGVDPASLHEVAEGDVLEIGEFTVYVEPAHDPDADHPVSFVVDHPTGTFFHGGDARPSEAFEAIGASYDLDLGVLAFGSAGMILDKETREPTYTRWYNDENDVVEAASQLRLDRLVPTHWDMWKGLTADPDAIVDHARSFDRPRSVEVREIGDSIIV
ncbi:MAG: MBL fold metallo-hydrolase [Haloarculaceae archaeon]